MRPGVRDFVPLLLDVFIWAILTCKEDMKEDEEKTREKIYDRKGGGS